VDGIFVGGNHERDAIRRVIVGALWRQLSNDGGARGRAAMARSMSLWRERPTAVGEGDGEIQGIRAAALITAVLQP